MLHKKPIIYCDMDQVLADFLTEYLDYSHKVGIEVKKPYSNTTQNPELFRMASLEHRIFEKLPILNGSNSLIGFLNKIESEGLATVEILTSVNSYEDDICESIKQQKIDWLKANDIHWKPNFVNACGGKSTYATLNSLLIDDNPNCTTPFEQAGGDVILFTKFDDNVELGIRKFLSKHAKLTKIAV